jgi:hypothetical protein
MKGWKGEMRNNEKREREKIVYEKADGGFFGKVFWILRLIEVSSSVERWLKQPVRMWRILCALFPNGLFCRLEWFCRGFSDVISIGEQWMWDFWIRFFFWWFWIMCLDETGWIVCNLNTHAIITVWRFISVYDFIWLHLLVFPTSPLLFFHLDVLALSLCNAVFLCVCVYT